MPRTVRSFPKLILALLILSACSTIQAPAIQTAASVPTALPSPTVNSSSGANLEMEKKTDKITSQALAGNLLGDPTERTFYIVLPSSYASGEKSYPVVYVLPWGTGEATSNVMVEYSLRKLLKEGEAQEMILVFPDGANSLGASQFRSSPTIGDYETYIVRELVDYVDTNYRTLAAPESRGIMGCSNGGDATMHLALKYPDVFGVAAPTGGTYDEALERNQILLQELKYTTTLPQDAFEVTRLGDLSPLIAWYIQAAAGTASNPDKPPLYLDMPFRIVAGHGEIVPEVAAKIADHDSMHEAERYVQQPLRLRGILIQHALNDRFTPTEAVRNFEHTLTELGIEHEYKEMDASHCPPEWDSVSLQFMTDHLVFEEP